MTLVERFVERFVEQHSWPDSRKTAWLAGLALPFQALGSLAVVLAADPGLIDTRLVNLANLGGLVCILVSGLLAWAALRRGLDARWSAYLFTGSFAVYTSVVMHGFGAWSSILLLWIPMTVLLCALWYDARVATVNLVIQLILLATGTVAVWMDVFDYAPWIRDRSLDAQDSVSWTVALALSQGAGVVAAFLMGVLVAMARDLQDDRLRRAFAMIRRYVPGQVAEALLANPDSGSEPHERRRLTIFFSDLVGFTDLSDELEPEDLSRLLNEYFAEMTAIAHEYGGTIDELSGDAILVFFGAPEATTDRDHALRAMRMGRDMQMRLAELNQRWSAEGRADRLEARIGINTGVVTVGNFGSPERMKYAALGRHVNAAARLQASCPPGRILLTHSTWLLVHDEIPCSTNGVLTLKGLHKPVETYLVDTLR